MAKVFFSYQQQIEKLVKEKDLLIADEEYAKALLLLSEDYNKKGDLANAIKYSQKTLEVYRELQEEKSF